MQSMISSHYCRSRLFQCRRRALILATTAISISSRSSTCTTAFSTVPSSLHHQLVPTKTKTATTQLWLSSSSSSKDDPRQTVLDRSPKEDHPVLERTLDWVEGVVIGLNLCPFAEKPFQQKNLRMEVIDGSDQADILARVLAESLVRKTQPGTSLMICPDLFPTNFYAFLEVYNMLQDGVLVDNELTEDIQVAPFHPSFEFEGSGEDGVDNYTNRSPYPIFHILREVEVGHAVDALQGDAGKVWRRNVDFLDELDKELSQTQLEQVMTGRLLLGQELQDTDTAVREKVKGILRDFKKQNNSE